jgi:hypothetical protein
MAEAEIWQWPIDSLNPTKTDMYMFTASQDFPGKGKRAAGAAGWEPPLLEYDDPSSARAPPGRGAEVGASLW